MKHGYKPKIKHSNAKIEALYDYRASIISTVVVYDYSSDIRHVLDDALSYYTTIPEEQLEFKECDLKHIMVNHIRHNNSSYELHLRNINNIGCNTEHRYNNNISYKMYRNAVLDSIARTYPFLKEECDQQKQKVNMVTIVDKNK